MLKPLHDNVILKKEKAEKETTTASGIILTDESALPNGAIYLFHLAKYPVFLLVPDSSFHYLLYTLPYHSARKQTA